MGVDKENKKIRQRAGVDFIKEAVEEIRRITKSE